MRLAGSGLLFQSAPLEPAASNAAGAAEGTVTPVPLMVTFPATPDWPFRSSAPEAEKLYVPVAAAVSACESVRIVPLMAVT